MISSQRLCCAEGDESLPRAPQVDATHATTVLPPLPLPELVVEALAVTASPDCAKRYRLVLTCTYSAHHNLLVTSLIIMVFRHSSSATACTGSGIYRFSLSRPGSLVLVASLGSATATGTDLQA